MPLDGNLHDLTNALAAARSYAEVLALRSKERGSDAALADALLGEIDRVARILRDVRHETYRAGDVLACRTCGYTFVYRRKEGTTALCRRCSSREIAHWRPVAGTP